MWERWTPSSRRSRRQSGRRSRRAATRGADRTFLVIAGLFVLGVIVVLAAIVVISGGL
jgi:hypothetical protein